MELFSLFFTFFNINWLGSQYKGLENLEIRKMMRLDEASHSRMSKHM